MSSYRPGKGMSAPESVAKKIYLNSNFPGAKCPQAYSLPTIIQFCTIWSPVFKIMCAGFEFTFGTSQARSYFAFVICWPIATYSPLKWKREFSKCAVEEERSGHSPSYSEVVSGEKSPQRNNSWWLQYQTHGEEEALKLALSIKDNQVRIPPSRMPGISSFYACLRRSLPILLRYFESIPSSNAPILSTPCSTLLNPSLLQVHRPPPRSPHHAALFWLHPSFSCPEPVPIMWRSFETNKFLILRFFSGSPQVTHSPRFVYTSLWETSSSFVPTCKLWLETRRITTNKRRNSLRTRQSLIPITADCLKQLRCTFRTRSVFTGKLLKSKV